MKTHVFTLRVFLILNLLVCFSFVAQSAPKPKHVVLIGLDGWGSYSYEKANIPNIKKLAQDGSYTLTKRTVLPSSSAVNWASMFMGAGPELHGYTTWGSKTPELPSREVNENGIFPTVFSELRKQKPNATIGCFYEWDGIKYLIDTVAVSHHKQSPDYNKNPRALTNMGVEYIKTYKPEFVSLIWDNPDHVGHESGHDTPEYYAKLEELDGYVGEIVEAVRRAGMLSQTVFIVTSDHGGIEKGHGKISMEEMETPFIISGKGIEKGAKIERSMMQFDVAAVIADLFGLKTPQVWIGRNILKE